MERLQKLVGLYENVFEMRNFTMPGDEHLQSLLDDARIIFFVAAREEERDDGGDGEIVGGLTAHVLPSTYFPAAEVYVYDLAVKTEFQRKGIGRQLMSALAEHCAASGAKEIFVQADLADQHALDFYRATGGRAASVVHFSYSLTNDVDK